jgi:hypothetical protein
MSDTLEFPEVEDIFASIGTDPMKAREAAREVLIQIGNDPEKLGASLIKSQRSKKAKSNKEKGQYLTEKSIEHYAALGYWPLRVDSSVTNRYGQVFAQDLMGIADLLVLCPGGKAFFVQVTTEEARTDHERKFCDDGEKVIRTGLTRYRAMEKLLGFGFKFFMMTWEKEGRFYAQPNIFEVTREWLDERKAKLDARRQK